MIKKIIPMQGLTACGFVSHEMRTARITVSLCFIVFFPIRFNPRALYLSQSNIQLTESCLTTCLDHFTSGVGYTNLAPA